MHLLWYCILLILLEEKTLKNENIQVAYLSFATLEFKLDPKNEIEKILKIARMNNEKKGITGQLVYRGGIFMQLLEGEQDSVSDLLGRILLDNSRHENVRVVLKQPMIKRVFPDWSMAYRELDNAVMDQVNLTVPWQKLVELSSTEQIVSSEDIFKVFQKLSA